MADFFFCQLLPTTSEGYIPCSPRQFLSHSPHHWLFKDRQETYFLSMRCEDWSASVSENVSLLLKREMGPLVLLLLLDIVRFAWDCWKCNTSCNHERIKLTTWGWQSRKIKRYPWRCNQTMEVINPEVPLPSTCNFMKEFILLIV